MKELYDEDSEVKVGEIMKLHEAIHLKIEEQNSKYMEQAIMCRKLVEVEIGDLVSVYLCKDRFLPWKFGKLKLMVDDLFKIVEKVGENAYKLELLDDYDISPIFNVNDLRPYHNEDLRASIFLPTMED